MLCTCREGKAKIANVGLAQMVQTTHLSKLNGMGPFAYNGWAALASYKRQDKYLSM